MTGDPWRPDRRTIEWVAGILHEGRIAETVRDDVGQRNAHPVGSDAYWRLVCEVAIEAITFDLARQAERWPDVDPVPPGWD